MQLIAASAAGFLGLLLGSFLNVVIYRLPLMLQHRWARECAEFQEQDRATSVFHLAYPRSHCPHCQHTLAWYHNWPVVSYLVLKGHCAFCHAAISWRYPAIELLTAMLFCAGVGYWGWTAQAFIWCALAASLLALSMIDIDTGLLPDAITLPLLWSGLLVASWQLNPHTGLQTAVWGAAGGYLFLWSVYWIFKGLTGKEGLGYGDFKLLAALGAWLGWQALLPIIFLASASGAVTGLTLQGLGRLNSQGRLPFGPFLAGSGLVIMVWGVQPFLNLWN